MLTNRLSASRRIFITVMRVLLVLAAVLTAALVVFMIVYVLRKGLPYVTWHLLSTKPSYVSGTIGILPDICNTVQILLASLLIVLPLGVGAAVYLTEYAQNKKLVAAIEYAAETLSGIPSIIYGLVGMLFFCEFLGMQTSLLAGALTLVIMNLPTVLRTTQESLRTVPQSYREGAFGLGAGKWRVVRTVVLPGCIDGIVTGCILSAGRILGESAALDHGKVDILVCSHLLQDKIALGVMPGKAGGHERKLGIESCEVRNGVADRAAGGLLDALGDVRQLILLRPGLNGIGNIHDHITRAANSFFHTSSLCFCRTWAGTPAHPAILPCFSALILLL